MERSTLWFIYMSLFYLGVGAVLGVMMIFQPATVAVMFRVHAHINLLGWVSMMIFGVSYHVIPRFSGRPMRYPRIIWPHFWLTNVGLVGMALAWTVGGPGAKAWGHLAGLFGVAISVGAGLFISNMLATIRAAPPPMVEISQRPSCAGS
jgi:heme/copper-type cytochrome/quinol oxidase subunit 1